MKEYDSEAFDGDSINSAPLGQRLRTAREGTGLGIEEVASLLNLEESLVRALEDEDYEVLPSPIFIRGYLRAYAKLLRLDGNELIEVYGMQSGGMDPDLATSSSTSGSLGGFPVVGLLGGAVALVLVAGVGWWLLSGEDVTPQMSQEEPLSSNIVAQLPADTNAIALPQQPKMQPTITAKVEPAVVPKVVAEPPEKVRSVVVDAEAGEHDTSSVLASIAAAKVISKEEPNKEVAPENVNGAATEQLSRSVQSAVNKAESDVVVVNKKVIAALNSSVKASSKTKASEKEVVVQGLSKLNVGPVAPSGGDVLLLSSAGDSWAEVFDANGYRLLYDMLKVDSAKRLQGTAPFKVFLGNSPLVAVSLNDAAVEQKRFNRKNHTARFVVDSNGVRRR